MGVSRSLSIGASALRSQQERFDVISNNIANTSTTGFKSSTVSFAEQFSQVYSMGKSPDSEGGVGSGGTNPMQFGLGVRTGSINSDMSQGAIESTNRPLDMALQGDGFFVYQFNGSQLFSRAGAVSRDRDGFLVDSSTGAHLQGYNVQMDANNKMAKDSNGVNILDRTVSNLQIESTAISEPRQTQFVTAQGNLSSAATEGTERKTSIAVFDETGGSHSVALTFTKTANPNEYSVNSTIDGVSVNLDTTTITFNADGTINTPSELNLTAADLNTALGSQIFDETSPKNINIRLSDPGNLGSSLTNFAGPNSVTLSGQDGYQAGDLLDLSVDSQGKIWGSFTNGQAEILGQTVVAKFSNSDGLIREGGNFFTGSPNSGLANIGTAGEIFPATTIVGSALESSNTDLTTEFTNMIATQRVFEAASRTITVTDQMLAIMNQLKR